ncbi:MAG: polysaccharide deacetylase family protein [Candidatus Hodarchaeales archaeon]|jgi:peptidoglycan/xylan/chitin deacetylase (PgdA/CDA1 family)
MSWIDSKKCVVCLTFDLDAEISWRNILRRNKIQRDNPVVLSQGTYGPKAGVPRILRLLKKYNIKAGFFIPGEVAELYPDTVTDIYKDGHEIGHHGYSHKNPASCTLSEEKFEMEKGIEVLEDITGEKPIGYRAPAADLSENTLDLLHEYDLIYDSSMMGDDLPFTLKTKKKDIIELPIRWMLDDWPFFGFNYFPALEYQSGIDSHRKVYEIWADEFEAVYEEGLYFMLAMHPQLIGVPSRAKMLENLIEFMKLKQDIWFATPSEIAAFWKEKGNEST